MGGWKTEFVHLDWIGRELNFTSNALFGQVDAQTAPNMVMGFSLGARYSRLGARGGRRNPP